MRNTAQKAKNYLLCLEEASKATGRPISRLKKDIMRDNIEATFERQIWMVTSNSLAEFYGEISLEELVLGPDRVIDYPIKNVFDKGDKHAPDAGLPSSSAKQPDPKESKNPEKIQIERRIRELESRKQRLRGPLENYLRKREAAQRAGRVPKTNEPQRKLLKQVKSISDEISKLRLELKHHEDTETSQRGKDQKSGGEQGNSEVKKKKRQMEGGQGGYYVPGRLANKRYYWNEED